jgi:hypothetical protein
VPTPQLAEQRSMLAAELGAGEAPGVEVSR